MKKYNTSYWFLLLGSPNWKDRIKDFPKYRIEHLEDGTRKVEVRYPNWLTGADPGKPEFYSYHSDRGYSFDFIKYDGVLGFLFNAGTVQISSQQWEEPRTYEWVGNVKDFCAEFGYDVMGARETIKIKMGAYLGYLMAFLAFLACLILLFFPQFQTKALWTLVLLALGSVPWSDYFHDTTYIEQFIVFSKNKGEQIYDWLESTINKKKDSEGDA